MYEDDDIFDAGDEAYHSMLNDVQDLKDKYLAMKTLFPEQKLKILKKCDRLLY